MKTCPKIAALIALVGLTAFGGAYDDYIKYTGSGTVSAWSNGAYWDDDGNPPGPGKNYYIGKSYYYGWNGETGKTFLGDKLVVANTFFFGGNADTKVGFGPDTEWIAGSKIFYYTPLQITGGGRWTISTTAQNPLKIEYSRSDSAYERTYPQDFASPSDGYAVMVKRSDSPNDTKGMNVSMTGDWSAYYGTFEVDFVHQFKRPASAGAFVCPGTLKFRDDTVMSLESDTATHEIGALDADGNVALSIFGALDCAGAVQLRGVSRLVFQSTDKVHEVGTLDMGAETTLTIPSGSSVTVSERLALAEGMTLKHGLQTKSSTNYEPKLLLFTLTQAAVEAGLPDFSKIKLVSTASGCTSKGSLPHVYIKVEETLDGGAQVFVTQKKIVEHITQDLGGSTSLDKPENWSNGELPDPQYDYYCAVYGGKGAQINFLNASDTRWNGGTLFMDSEYAPVMLMNAHDVTIPDLWLSSKAYIRPMGSKGQIYDLRGKLSVPAGGTGRLQLGDGNTLRVHSDLGGAGILNIKYGGENNTLADYLYGNLELRGDNRNFTGKFVLSMDGCAKYPAAVPSATLNVTARVYDGFAFGGERDEFTYDALTVSNHCRVAVMEDADFTPVNRGWYLTDGEAFIQVAEGKKATLRSVLTLENALNLVKEGPGSLWINQRVAIADEGSEGTITVSEGTLGVGASDVLGMLNVYVAEGAKIGVPLNGDGFDPEYGTSYFTYEGETLALSIDMSGASEAKYAVKLLSYNAGGEWDEKLPVVTLDRAPAGYRIAGLRRVDEGSAMTLVADVERVPFAFIVK